nr:RNA-directed DNA polymerase, eukaryota [Tanacetum cinerariifolium]
MGDFNEVRSIDERFGSMFNQSSSRLFNHFITSSGLVDIKLEGYSFTWAHPSATKMSKLDCFLVSEDYGPLPFCFYHSWFKWDGFDVMVEQAWNFFSHSDSNGLIQFKKKLQDLKKIIRSWIKDKKLQQSGAINSIKKDLIDIDKNLDSRNVFDEILLKRMELTRQLHDINQMEAMDYVQKSKIKWAIEGDENSKFFHGIINKKRYQLSIRGVFVDGDWNTARSVSRDEIRVAVWNCDENKSPGPDGYTFEFFRRYWSFIGSDFCSAVECFFESGSFPKGNNSSFIALISVTPPKSDFAAEW